MVHVKGMITICFALFLMDRLRIASFNARGMTNKNKRKSLFSYFKNNKYDVVCLQETHIIDRDREEWQKQWGGVIFYSEGTNRSKGEVILISKYFKGEVQLKLSQERILVVSVVHDRFNITIANVYAPNITKDKIDYFQNLVDILKVYEDDDLIVVGD
jgi:exonuclease III